MGTQGMDLDAVMKREQLALEKLKEQLNRNAVLEVAQEYMRKKLAEVTAERGELARSLEASGAELVHSQLVLKESRLRLEKSEAVVEESTKALEELEVALSESQKALQDSNTTLSTKDADLVETRTNLGLSERLHELTKTALSESTTVLCDVKVALAESNRELFERQAKSRFLSRLMTAADTVHETLRLANNSVQAGANPVFAISENVGPEIDRMLALVDHWPLQ